VTAFEPDLFETKLFQQPSSFMPRGMSWRLHLSIAGIGGCLGDGDAQRHSSLGRSRARVLSQRWRTHLRQAACVLFKELLKQHRPKQRHGGNPAASKHSAPPGGEIGLLGLGQLNNNMWSHDQFFLSDHWMGQSIRGGAWGLREGDSVRCRKFPLSRAKMKLEGGNKSARAEVLKMSFAANPQDAAA
jgi:hypothetical protein